MDCSVLLLAFILRWKRVCIAHNNCMKLPIDMGNSIYFYSLIYFWNLQLFLHSDQPLSEGEIIPFSGVAVGGGCIIHAGGGGGFTHWLTDCFDVQPTTTSGNIITQSIISALASANSFVYFCIRRSSITLTHLHINGAAFASFSSLAFLSRWAL